MNKKNLKHETHRSLRGGLSLLELLVVLTILIALGGIVVSTLPGMLKRTQVATAAANIPEIDASVRRNSLLNQGQIGNRFDSLITGSSGLDGEVPSYVGGSENFQASSLSEGELEALQEIGISELIPANESAENATFSSHGGFPVELSTDSKICRISPAIAPQIMLEQWNLETDEDTSYVVVGLGQQSTLIGAGETAAFPKPPVHFSDERMHSPEVMYSRYLLIIELKQNSETDSEARYIGAAIPGKNGIRSVSRELEEHYSGKQL